MKYIVTESQMGKVADRYLETISDGWKVHHNGHGEFTITDDNEQIITYTMWEGGLYSFKPSLIVDLVGLLNLEQDDAVKYLIDWLNKNYGTEHGYASWGYLF